MSRDDVLQVTQVNADVGIQWLFSFLSADKKKTYCLYEAPNAEAIREAAQRLNVPADEISKWANCGQRCSCRRCIVSYRARGFPQPLANSPRAYCMLWRNPTTPRPVSLACEAFRARPPQTPLPGRHRRRVRRRQR